MPHPQGPGIRVEYCPSGNVKACRPDVVRGALTLKALLKRAGNKLRFKARRAFFADGTELTDDGGDCGAAVASRAAACGAAALRLYVTKGDDWGTGQLEERQRRLERMSPEAAAAAAAGGRAAVPTVEQALAGVERAEAGQGPRVRLLCSRAHLDDEAVRQLLGTAASLPGVRLAVGMPDLHAGKGCPIGAAFVTSGRVYPHLIDRDAGCGMSVVRTSLTEQQLSGKRLGRAADRLRGLDGPWEGGSPAEWLAAPLEWPAGRPVPPAAAWPREVRGAGGDGAPAGDFAASLGTVGRGNHFAEALVCERTPDAEAAAGLGLEPGRVYALVHSGSRGLGGAVLDDHAAAHGGAAGLEADSDEGRRYLALHAHALAWARRNRALAARRFLEALGCPAPSPEDCVLDIYHNAVEHKAEFECKDGEGGGDGGGGGGGWIHRKGAAPGDRGAVVIPGSRGHRSYVVVPCGDQASAAWSMAHGAGRKWHRTKALAANRARHPNPRDLLVTELNSRVVCDDRALVYEEAPSAYKDIADVVADLEAHGLVRVVAVLRPLLTYKTRSA